MLNLTNLINLVIPINFQGFYDFQILVCNAVLGILRINRDEENKSQKLLRKRTKTKRTDQPVYNKIISPTSSSQVLVYCVYIMRHLLHLERATSIEFVKATSGTMNLVWSYTCRRNVKLIWQYCREHRTSTVKVVWSYIMTLPKLVLWTYHFNIVFCLVCIHPSYCSLQVICLTIMPFIFFI